mmetsp:Transcript_7966/g.24469  ORF Transcript_7966/g.24469 Transcript_7966/m.24469 type:complete len:284 (+) Transcript_7966:2321-3172(+)
MRPYRPSPSVPAIAALARASPMVTIESASMSGRTSAATSTTLPAAGASRLYMAVHQAATGSHGTTSAGRQAWRMTRRRPRRRRLMTAYGSVGASVTTTATEPLGSVTAPARSVTVGESRLTLPAVVTVAPRNPKGRSLSSTDVSGRMASTAAGDHSETKQPRYAGCATAAMRTSSCRAWGGTVASHTSARAAPGVSDKALTAPMPRGRTSIVTPPPTALRTTLPAETVTSTAPPGPDASEKAKGCAIIGQGCLALAGFSSVLNTCSRTSLMSASAASSPASEG